MAGICRVTVIITDRHPHPEITFADEMIMTKDTETPEVGTITLPMIEREADLLMEIETADDIA